MTTAVHTGGRRPAPQSAREHNRKRRDLNRHRGIDNRLAPTQASERLALLRQSMTWVQLARESGCSASYLRDIAAGRVPRINRVTHNKIMTVRLAATPDPGMYIDATGTVRRVRALMARGHSQYTIADAADTTQYRINLLSKGPARVRQMLADKIRRGYEQLADTPGTSTRAARIATERHWPGPGYWDPDTIDNPAFQPATEQATRLDSLVEDALWLIDRQDYTREQAAARLGITHAHLNTCLARWRKQQAQAEQEAAA